MLIAILPDVPKQERCRETCTRLDTTPRRKNAAAVPAVMGSGVFYRCGCRCTLRDGHTGPHGGKCGRSWGFWR